MHAVAGAKRGKMRASQIGFGFVSHWSKKWREFPNQSQIVLKQNQSNCVITFDTRLKTALSTMGARFTTAVFCPEKKKKKEQ